MEQAAGGEAGHAAGAGGAVGRARGGRGAPSCTWPGPALEFRRAHERTCSQKKPGQKQNLVHVP